MLHTWVMHDLLWSYANLLRLRHHRLHVHRSIRVQRQWRCVRRSRNRAEAISESISNRRRRHRCRSCVHATAAARLADCNRFLHECTKTVAMGIIAGVMMTIWHQFIQRVLYTPLLFD
jgi:hypothetical protein